MSHAIEVAFCTSTLPIIFTSTNNAKMGLHVSMASPQSAC